MSRRAALADSEAQETVVRLVRGGCTRTEAARWAGVSSRTIRRHELRDPAFAAALADAEDAHRTALGVARLQRLVHPPPRREPAGGWHGVTKAQRRARRQAKIEERLAALTELARKVGAP